MLYWLGVAAVAALLAYEHALVRPGDLRRLDAAFFTDERHHQRRLLRLRARGSCFVKVAALYDVHGNLPALEAVLAEVPDDAVIVSGGDVFSGPMPAETLARLRGLGSRVHFIRGNADRDLGPYEERWRARYEWLMAQLTPEEHALAEAWPPTATLEVDGLGRTLFCHGTPRSDLEAITAVTSDERLREILSEVSERTVVCGHTHHQFDRVTDNIRVVNAPRVDDPVLSITRSN